MSDVCISDNDLYILLYSNSDDEVTCNTVIQFAITGNDVKSVQIINLGDGYFGSICVYDKQLIAFELQKGALVSYQL
jgi:hypothetical protein